MALLPLLLYGWQSQQPQERRQVLQKLIGGTAGCGVLLGKSLPVQAAVDSFAAYQVYPDATRTLSPTLSAIQVRT